MTNTLKKRINYHTEILNNLSSDIYNKFDELCINVAKTIKYGHKIISFGNGGSAADSIHFTGELVSKYKSNRRSFPALSLNSNTSIITSIGNDFGFEKIFVRQLEGLYKDGDFILCLSTSGNSANILEAIKYMNAQSLNYCLLTGVDGGESKKISKFSINIPSNNVAEIQEVHYIILHAICDFIENNN